MVLRKGKNTKDLSGDNLCLAGCRLRHVSCVVIKFVGHYNSCGGLAKDATSGELLGVP